MAPWPDYTSRGGPGVYCRRMSAELAATPLPEPAGAPPPFFHRGVTALSGALVLCLAAIALWPAPALDGLERPEDSLGQLVGHEMDLRRALREAPAAEQRLYAFLFGSDAEARTEAIGWYDEVVQATGSPLAELHRMVLSAEEGRDRVLARLDALAPEEDWGRRLAMWARLAYGREAPDADAVRAALRGVREELEVDWFTDRLAARLAARLGDRETEARADAAVLARGRRLLQTNRGLFLAQALLVGCGVVLLRVPPGARAGAGAALLPAPWGGADGGGLFARGALGLLGPTAVARFLPDTAWMRTLVSVASGVPLVACLWAYGRSRGLSVAAALGLGRAGVLRAAVGLVGLSTLSDLVVETVASRVGWASHWSDGFQETLVWGATDRVLTDLLDSVVVAPIVEELLFRGVLYGTLRRWMAPLPAAALSAGLFAVAHGYGAVGFVEVFASGLLWAVAYEWTRSLVPSMVAHAAGNLLAAAIVLLTLRP
jgi:membrane protease YdiL (CAAX protease family)